MANKKSTRGKKKGLGKRTKVRNEPFSYKALSKILDFNIKKSKERRT